MSFELKTYNVLLFEPESVPAGLRLAADLLAGLEQRANDRIEHAVVPELAGMGLVPEHMPPAEFAARSHELPGPVAEKIEIPHEEQFVVDTRPYEVLGRVPRSLADFGQLYEALAPAGVAVAFFNTACADGGPEYADLAEALPAFPALAAATWIATTSLRHPAHPAFLAHVDTLAEGPAAGQTARRRMLREGRPYLLPLGESIVMRAQKEAIELAWERLRNIRQADA